MTVYVKFNNLCGHTSFKYLCPHNVSNIFFFYQNWSVNECARMNLSTNGGLFRRPFEEMPGPSGF